MDSVLTKSDLVLAEEALAALVAGGGSIDATATGITTLTDALVVLQADFATQEIISDFFRVSDTDVTYDAAEHFFTADEFCLEAGKTLEFHLNLSSTS